MDNIIPDPFEGNNFNFFESTAPTAKDMGLSERNMGGYSRTPIEQSIIRPGREANDRPIQGPDGKWRTNFGTTVTSSEQAQAEEQHIQNVRDQLRNIGNNSDISPRR